MATNKKEKRLEKDVRKFGILDFLHKIKKVRSEKILDSRLDLIRRLKIQWRLILVFLLLSIGPLVILGISSYDSSKTVLRDTIKQYTSQVITQFGTNVSNEINKSVDAVDSLLFSSIIQDNFRANIKADQGKILTIRNNLSKEMIVKTTQVSSISYTVFYPSAGDLPIFTGLNNFSIPFDELNKEFEATEDKAKWYTDENGKIAYVKKGVHIEVGSKTGNMFIELEPNSIKEIFDSFHVNESVQIFFLHEDGQILYSSREDLEVGSFFPDASLFERFRQEAAETGATSAGIEANFEGKAECNFYKIEQTPFYIVAITPHSFLNSAATEIGKRIVIVAIGGILISILLAFVISGSISKPLSKLVNIMRKAKQGDLTEEIQDNSKDEIGEVITNYNDMINNIKTLIQKVKASVNDVLDISKKVSSSSEQTYASSEQIALTLQEVAKGSSEQAQEVSQSVDYMNHLSDGINKVTDDLSHVSSLIMNTEDISVQAITVVKTLNDKANQTQTASQKIVEEINSLNNDMKQIRKIVKVIVGIAEQTNLLSLNAAIEAARAGEAGRGFAVVAEEVRKLADQSKDASIMINNIINAINNKTEQAVSEANGTSDIIMDQMSAVQQTDAAFNTISRSMKEISSHMKNMGDSVNSMLTLKEKTLLSMENISAVSQEAAATSEEVSAGTQEQMASAEILTNLSKEMNQMGEELEHAVSMFKVE
ncbi:MAG: HAMP domain-containing protein [Clostridiaceae bacterium]|nr:HAMP domain-containing protein [Clostridiaceae bacterium]